MIRSLIIAAASFAVMIGIYFAGGFRIIENKIYDIYMQKGPDTVPYNDDIVFIEVDQQSIIWAEENKGWTWPWPREAYAELVDFISATDVNSIAFDIFYADNSVYGKEDDERFALACKNSGKVINAMFVSEDDDQTVMFPIESIKNGSAIIANVNSKKDDEVDDIIRRGRTFYDYESNRYPMLGLAALSLTGEEIEDIPTLKDGSVYLRFHPDFNEAYYPYSAGKILESYDYWSKGLDIPEDRDDLFVPEDFSEKYVFCALYAPGLFDICSTPVSQVYPGCGVHITTLDNYLSNSFIRKTPEIFLILFYLIVAFFGSFIITFAENFNSQRKIVSLIVGGFIFSVLIIFFLSFGLFIGGIWLQMAGPLLTFVLSFLVALGFSYSVEGKQKRFIKNAFSQCQSKEFVNIIVNNPSKFVLGGEKYNMTAFFSDIQKFSSLSEILTANQLGELLNYYLTKMSDVFMAEGGTIDKYEGDSIVALMGAPVELEDHASRTCRAAIKMKKAELQMNKDIYNIVAEKNKSQVNPVLYAAFNILVKNEKTLFTRIGINSGEMIAGLFGSERKKNYTMMGNNVNLASRLEGVNKQYSTGGIIISEFTRELIGDEFIVRSLDRIRVVNIDKPVRIYELIEERKNASEELLTKVSLWQDAIKLFEEKNFKGALELFTKVSNMDKEDKVALYYINLINNYFIKGKYPVESSKEGIVYNPENGVFTLLQK